MTHITDGMRFRALELMSSELPIASAAELRTKLDAAITDLETKHPEAFKELVRPKNAGPDFEHHIEVDPWDLFSFSTYFRWGQRTVGFGEYSISVRREGDEVIVSASNENMNVRWQRQALMDAVDGIFKHIPDNINFLDLPKGEFRIKVPEEVLQSEKQLASEVFDQIGEPEEKKGP